MFRFPMILVASLVLFPGAPGAHAQDRLFPPRDLMPGLLAGARDPGTSATVLGVVRNPNAHGPGMEVELAIGSTLPVLLLTGHEAGNPVVVGIEAGVFARFGLQVLEREIIATDWIFAVPVIRHHEHGWTRFRYYHSSSHIGDEYSRRFEDQGVNFSRDAVEVLTFRRLREALGAWAGVRYGYNVHPQDDERWVLRAGGQMETLPDDRALHPFLAADLEWDQEAGEKPRLEVRLGVWLPELAGRRSLRVSLTVLSGPSPLGQFHGLSTTQFGLSLQGNL